MTDPAMTDTTTYAVLLRAINVGGRNKIPMADLRALLADAGFGDVSTYIQSGNVVCTSERDSGSVSSEIRAAIADRFGHDIEVMVRTASEVASLAAGFPYADADPKSSGIVFLNGAYDGELDASAFAPDECTMASTGVDVFVNCPSGFADTKLTAAWIEKQTGRAATRRNQRTVEKLLAMTAP